MSRSARPVASVTDTAEAYHLFIMPSQVFVDPQIIADGPAMTAGQHAALAGAQVPLGTDEALAAKLRDRITRQALIRLSDMR